MFLRTILFIGIHLLCLTNVASPMVLLTANVEDIKKIARKFLSDNVADTIAEFLLKATGGLRSNQDAISEENDQNQQDINNISLEGKIGRAGKRRPTTSASDYVDYDVKTTKRHKKITPPEPIMVYNKPAFEPTADRLEGDTDEDFRTDTTANDETQIKQAKEIYQQRMKEEEYEKYDETSTVGGDQYDVETMKARQPKYNTDEEEEFLPKYTSSQYNKKAKHRLIATSGSIILPRLDGSQE